MVSIFFFSLLLAFQCFTGYQGSYVCVCVCVFGLFAVGFFLWILVWGVHWLSGTLCRFPDVQCNLGTSVCE